MRKGKSPCRTFYRGIVHAGSVLLMAGLVLAIIPASLAEEAVLANTCNGRSDLSYPTALPFSAVGDIVRVRITVGAGEIQGGSTLAITAVRFLLDCNSGSPLDLNCVDEGPIVSYQGNITDTCADVDWTTVHPVNDTLPNDVVFTPTALLNIPAQNNSFCAIEFDVKIESQSIDGTPGVIEEVSGYSATDNDGVCNTVPPLQTSSTSSGSMRICNCDDGLFCNGTETCDRQNGCQPGTPPNCEDAVACTIDSCDETTDSCVHTPDNLQCDNGLFCDGFETCNAELGCLPGTPVDCNDQNACTTDSCNENTDTCDHIPITCDDGLFCNGTETCDPNVGCVPGTPPNCDDAILCTIDSCDEATDACVHSPNNDACDDGLFCNGVETCSPKLGCVPGTPPNCDDGNVCTVDSCNEDTDSCDHVPNPVPCDDGLFCNGVETCDPTLGCVPGTPPNCDDGVQCTIDACNEETDSCTHTPDDNACNDGLFCNGIETCNPTSGCVPGTPPNCDDSNVCTIDSCNEATDACDHISNAGACDDHDVCTDDVCDTVKGCLNIPNSARCDDGNACTTDACDPISGCSHTLIDCNDHDKCTNDSCVPATGCVTTPASCDDGNACTNDACDSASGCTHNTINCSDQNKCTNDSCNPSTGCVFSDVDCGDGNACTTDACDPASGCSHTTIDCGDHNACTNDRCDPKFGCQYETLVCDDSNFCTDDSCSEASGCVFTPNNNPCDDNSVCNGREICTAGQCRRGAPLNCDDNNACTDDCCDGATGCSHAPVDGCDALAAAGCTLTAGAVSSSGTVDPNVMAGTGTVNFSGQVAAITGVVSTPDLLDQIQGYWRAQRLRKGTLNALSYSSMACGCDGVFNGTLCPDVDHTPGTVLSPASMVCFSGVADYSGANRNSRRAKHVAFRIEVEDRGAPGTAPNASNPGDIYRMRIWVPKGNETADGLAGSVACPVRNPEQTVRPANFTDTGSLTTGDISINPAAGASH